MSRKIYTYTDLAHLRESRTFHQIRHIPQIAVSSDLRKGLKGSMAVDHTDGLFREDPQVLVTEFGNLVMAADQEWNSDRSRFERTILLASYLRKHLEETDDPSAIRWLTGCMRNLDAMQNAVMLLEQAAVKPQDLPCTGDRNVELLRDAWENLREEDESLAVLSEKLESLNTKEKWETVLCAAFGEKRSFAETGKLVFHGFYHITPFQERFMRQLERAGFELLFLFPYDERYPFVYEVWEKTYDVGNGYPPKSEWKMERSQAEDVYGDIFAGRTKVKLSNHLSIREYPSVLEFADAVKKIRRENIALYSADYKRANRILRDYFPDAYGERMLLAYPVGRFVGVLNRMWEEELGSVVLEKRDLITAFSSGWLVKDGIPGSVYLQELTDLLPFFRGCRTSGEWRARIALFREIEEKVLASFETEKEAEKSIARWQESMENPLVKFGVFAGEKERRNAVLVLIEQLLSLAEQLYAPKKRICISEHMQRLAQVLAQCEHSEERYEEEQALMAEIFRQLERPGDMKLLCAPGDLTKALDLYFSGRLEEEEQPNRIGLVYPLYFVDAACIKNRGRIHICLSDGSSLPGKQKEYPWPLSRKVIRKCLEKTGNPLLFCLQRVMDQGAEADRYFIYCAVKNRDVTFSWVSNFNGKHLTPSAYLTLFEDAAGIQSVREADPGITGARVESIPYGTEKVRPYDVGKAPCGMAKEARMTYALCPMRYTLSYILEKYPSYHSEFQENYAVNPLIQSLLSLLKTDGVTKEEVYQNVIELFPQLCGAEKRQIYDYLQSNGQETEAGHSDCGSFSYTDERLKLEFPNPQVWEVVLARFAGLSTPDGRTGMDLKEKMVPTQEEMKCGRGDAVRAVCSFCPQIDLCRNAVFAADQEEYYD